MYKRVIQIFELIEEDTFARNANFANLHHWIISLNIPTERTSDFTFSRKKFWHAVQWSVLLKIRIFNYAKMKL